MQNLLTKKKNQLYVWIYIYKKRRKAAEKKYIKSPTKEGRIQYKKITKRLDKKILQWGVKLDQLKDFSRELSKINKAVKDYTGVNIKNYGESKKHEYKLPKKMFCKYALENNIPSPEIAKYLGMKSGNNNIEKLRLRYNKVLTTSVEDKISWEIFKNQLNLKNGSDK